MFSLTKAGTTLNIQMLRENGKVNRSDFNLNLDLSSILCDFERDEVKNLESAQVGHQLNNFYILYIKVRKLDSNQFC